MSSDQPNPSLSLATPALEHLNISELCASYLASEAGKLMVRTWVAKTVEDAVSRELRRGKFSEELQRLVERTMNLPASFDIASYNETIVAIVRERVLNVTHQLSKQVGAELQELLETPPETIKLSELVQQYLDFLKPEEDEDCNCYSDQEKQTATVLWEPDSRSSNPRTSFNYLELSDKPGMQKYSCDIRIGFHNQEIFQLTFKDVANERALFIGPHVGFAKTLFQMKAFKTKVTLDPEALDDLELYYGPDRD